jgi:radical SAM superfamily enzyme YgiQ (UPF0313 family)
MKVLLIQPPPGTDFGFTNVLRIEPLGVECVGAALEHDDHEVRVIDMRLDDWNSLQSQYEVFGPDAVGVSCQFITDVYPALHVGGFLRALDPKVFLFVGGHHATLQASDFMFEGTPFDALVAGEGEYSSQGLIQALQEGKSIYTVPGIITPANQHNGFPQRHTIENMDEIMLPARHLTKRYRKKYHQANWVPTAAVETSRGCPFNCNFCSVWVFYKHRVRRRSPSRIIDDLDRIPENNIFFTDDIAFLHRPGYKELGNRIKDMGMSRNFAAETRADLVVRHQDMFDLWRSIGMQTIFMGIEKIDDDGLKSVRKHTDKEKNALAIRILQDKGIRPMPSFIIDPQWTESDFDRLEAYVEAMQLDHPTFTILTPLPGTGLYEVYCNQIVTHNYLMYDLAHTVLPTKLSLERFYERFARLYNMSAKHVQIRFASVMWALRMHFRGYGFVFWRLLRAMNDLRNPKAFLEIPVEEPPPGVSPFAYKKICSKKE